MNADGGVMYIGSKGKLLHDTYGANPRLLPQSLHDSYGAPPAEARAHPDEARDELGRARSRGTTRRRARSSTRRSCTEMMLLGVVSLRAGDEDLLRRREHARHQRRRREPVPDARVPGAVKL